MKQSIKNMKQSIKNMKQSIKEGFTGLKVSDEVIDRTEHMIKIHGTNTYLVGFEKALKVIFRMKSLEGDQKGTLELIGSLSKEEMDLINKAVKEEREFLKK